MGDYTQADRAFRVDTPLGEDELLLEAFSGQERISTPFRYTLELLSENDAIQPTDLLEQPVRVSLRLADGSDRYFHGHVSRFVQLGKSEELTSYEAEVVPWLWFLSLTRDCRVFQQMNVLDIVKKIFGEYSGAEYRVNCIQSYSPREYCVQYRESDLNFISRLMEEEGIYYFVEHAEDGHTVILVDDPSMVEPCPSQSTFQVATTPDSWLEEDVITEVQREHLVNTSRVTLRDYDYLQPGNNLEASRGSDGAEFYEYPGGYSELSEGERYADLLLQEQRNDRETMRGSSTCRTLTTGYSFELTGYYVDAANQGYLVVGVWHTARGGGYRSGNPDANYTNQFEGVPASRPYRPPRRARKPVVQGSQTAVVVGPEGEEIYTDPDGHGRVKIQFHWDRIGEKDESSSCWVRVSHPWAGKGWGMLAIPRIGQEVIVDFLEGDPDRPIITGRVYNQNLKAPFSPEDGVVAGVKSQTHQGSGYNQISMDDTAGQEKLTIHAQHDMSTTVLNDRTTTIKGPSDTLTVETGKRSVTVKGDASLTIQAGNRTVKVTGGDYKLTSSDAVKLHGKGAGASIKGDAAGVKIVGNGGPGVKIGGTPNVDVSGSAKVLIQSPVVDVGNASIKIHGSVIKLQGGGGSITLDGSGVTISGPMVKIN